MRHSAIDLIRSTLQLTSSTIRSHPRHSSFKLEAQKQLRQNDSKTKIGILQGGAYFFWSLRQQARTLDVPKLPYKMGFEPRPPTDRVSRRQL